MISFGIFSLVFGILPTVLSQTVCEDKCIVTDSSITTENYRNWPISCTTVCGNLYINGARTNLTENQLTFAVKNLKILYGRLQIEFTKFTNFNKFLPDLREVYYGIVVGQNSELSDLSVLQNWKAMNPFVWHVALNPKLDFSPYCEKQNSEENVDFNAYGNLKSCDCMNVRIGTKALAYYSNCSTITGGLKIQTVNSSLNWTAVSKLTKLAGNLEISETDLEDLSFLANLETIDLTSFHRNFTFKIFNNPKLRRLGFDSLKTILPKNGTVILANNHPDFCLTTNEFQLFAENNLTFQKIQARFCSNLTRRDGEKTCIFENLKTLDSECQHIIGDVKIGSADDTFVEKLKNVTNIHGALEIEDTEKLEDLSFLGSLRQVASLKMDTILSNDSGFDKSPIIRIKHNRKLKNVTFPVMQNPPYPNPVIEVYGNYGQNGAKFEFFTMILLPMLI